MCAHIQLQNTKNKERKHLDMGTYEHTWMLRICLCCIHRKFGSRTLEVQRQKSKCKSRRRDEIPLNLEC